MSNKDSIEHAQKRRVVIRDEQQSAGLLERRILFGASGPGIAGAETGERP